MGTLRFRHLTAVGIAVALGATACGDDGESDGDDGATATTTAGGSETTAGSEAGGSDLQLDEPVRIVAPIGLPGVDTSATPDASNGLNLAVDQLNAAGGIGGHPVELELVNTPVAPQEAATAVRLAYTEDPTVLIGLPVSAQVSAVIRDMDDGGVPFLHLSSLDDLAFGAGGSEWGFRMRTPASILAGAAATFAIEDIGAESIALSYINSEFGQSGAAAQREVLEEAGIEIHADLPHPQDASDLTADILEAQGADAVLAFDFPNDMALWLRQARDNGLDVPTIGGGSTQVMVSGGLADGLLENVYAADDCSPASDESAAEFAAAYEAEFGMVATGTAALAYDAVMIAAHVIEEQGSADPEAMREGLRNLDYQGACKSYVGDPETHDLATQISIFRFNEDGSPETVATIE